MAKNRIVPLIPLVLGGGVFVAASVVFLNNMNDDTAVRMFLPAAAFFIFTVILHYFIR